MAEILARRGGGGEGGGEGGNEGTLDLEALDDHVDSALIEAFDLPHPGIVRMLLEARLGTDGLSCCSPAYRRARPPATTAATS